MSQKKTTKTPVKSAKVLTLKGGKSLNDFFRDLLSVKADEMSMEAMTYLALTLVKKGETIGWKELITRFNSRSKGLPTASVTSDPSAGKHDGWNLRNQLWNFEHRADTGCHAQGKGALSLKTVSLDAGLVKKLHSRFFKAAKK